MPTLGPALDHDPFADLDRSGAAATPKLGPPLDHDPFADDAPKDPTWYGQIGEVPSGIAAGAVESAGLALKGISAGQPTERYENYLDQIEHGVRYRSRDREGRLPITDDTAYTDMLQRIADDPGMFQSQQLWLRHAIEGARGGDPEALKLARSKLPGAVRERDLWKAGEVVSEFAEETFPATPGYEDTLGRVVGEGLGSLASGVATSIVTGPAGGAVFFTAMGMGEAAERAASGGCHR